MWFGVAARGYWSLFDMGRVHQLHGLAVVLPSLSFEKRSILHVPSPGILTVPYVDRVG
jgi:hypothetical protein